MFCESCFTKPSKPFFLLSLTVGNMPTGSAAATAAAFRPIRGWRHSMARGFRSLSRFPFFVLNGHSVEFHGRGTAATQDRGQNPQQGGRLHRRVPLRRAMSHKGFAQQGVEMVT